MCEDLLRQLSAEQFRRYRPAQGLGVLLNVRYATIDRYTQVLKDTIRLLREGKAVPPDWIGATDQMVSLDRFLTSEDGYYLNVEDAIEKFRQAGLSLCYEMTLSDTETVGLPEHNLRMLTKLFINLRELTTALIEVSLT